MKYSDPVRREETSTNNQVLSRSSQLTGVGVVL
jgi:hypothetical protein